MKRRNFTRAALLGAVAAGQFAIRPSDVLALTEPQSTSPRRAIPWQNWSGYQKATPAQRVTPKSEQELADYLKQATLPVRPVGAGHSFTALVPTDGCVLSTRHFNQIQATADLKARVGAGVRLGSLAQQLHELGQALPNMPDINQQTVAGAFSTGTHGTGVNYSAMHHYVDGLRLVTPRGEILDCSRAKNPELFDAARVSLGSLGVITEYQLANVAPYKLKRVTQMLPLDEVLENFHQLAAQHRNFEMYYIPHCDSALLITTDYTDEAIKPRGEDTDNDSVRDLQKLRDYTAWWPGLRRKLISTVAAATEKEEHVDWWWSIYPSERAVRFNEMEYHLPQQDIVPALRQVREIVEQRHPDVFFPIEVRVVQEDDAWLSPFYKRPTASLAVHRYYAESFEAYFAEIEPVYQAMAGRPHWGKLHTLNADVLSQRYPKWKEFSELRAELDPNGVMLNPHLREVFGLA
ncbi:FAD-binding protein [Spongiibacter sp. KMU-158]|uniref:FAD-binding protein n=1 Tax=Spongiibacter pelagi TaxID=2760804 RepID=A0A927GV50_9GAMM|nr:D-arabinono-1,4-lactone oxidase [Spongiibacter pelagi]MBD2858020.1 FAD-binding protein [Spongiibacter pelagi]